MYDGDAAVDAARIYGALAPGLAPPPALRTVKEIGIGTNRWTLAIGALPGFGTRAANDELQTVLAVGVAGSVLLALLAALLAWSQRQGAAAQASAGCARWRARAGAPPAGRPDGHGPAQRTDDAQHSRFGHRRHPGRRRRRPYPGVEPALSRTVERAARDRARRRRPRPVRAPGGAAGACGALPAQPRHAVHRHQRPPRPAAPERWALLRAVRAPDRAWQRAAGPPVVVPRHHRAQADRTARAFAPPRARTAGARRALARRARSGGAGGGGNQSRHAVFDHAARPRRAPPRHGRGAQPARLLQPGFRRRRDRPARRSCGAAAFSGARDRRRHRPPPGLGRLPRGGAGGGAGVVLVAADPGRLGPRDRFLRHVSPHGPLSERRARGPDRTGGASDQHRGRASPGRAGPARLAEDRFRSLVDHAPVPLWQQDWSQVGLALARLRQDCPEDLGAWLRARPQEIRRLATLVRIRGANGAALAHVGQHHKDLAALTMAQYFDVLGESAFVDAVLALAAGAQVYSCDSSFRRLDGSARQHALTLLVMPGHAEELDFVIVTTVDITERKRVDAELLQLASTDFLTGLPNRREFMARMEDQLARLQATWATGPRC
ncbi:GGDEF domain-containing protein [Massilia sp. B-10]|nr:GGDEF domain-containing protein [Massilia sp. B-10]